MAEPGSLSDQPCSFCEVTTSGGNVHPLLSWGRSVCCPHIQERRHSIKAGRCATVPPVETPNLLSHSPAIRWPVRQ